jgi:hypothetical protein
MLDVRRRETAQSAPVVRSLFCRLVWGRTKKRPRPRPCSIRSLLKSSLDAGLSPADVLRDTFTRWDVERCLRVFGLHYPPLEFASSHANLRDCVKEENKTAGDKRTDREIACADEKALRLDVRLLEHEVVTGSLPAAWTLAVLRVPSHPLHYVLGEVVKKDEIERRLSNVGLVEDAVRVLEERHGEV